MRKSSSASPLRCFLLANGVVKALAMTFKLRCRWCQEGWWPERFGNNIAKQKSQDEKEFPKLNFLGYFPPWASVTLLQLSGGGGGGGLFSFIWIWACVIKSLGRCEAVLGISWSLGRTRSFYSILARCIKIKFPRDVHAVRVHKEWEGTVPNNTKEPDTGGHPHQPSSPAHWKLPSD